MNTTIMAISMEERSHFAPEFQEALTRHGCIIKTRLGLHEAADESCSDRGLILLQLCGNKDQVSELKNDILSIEEGIKVNTMSI